MRLESLKNTFGSRARKIRVGRGESSGKGKTSGRGHKGQWARKGHKYKEGFEGGQMRLIRRIPKRGFKNPARLEYLPVNVGELNGLEGGMEVTVSMLRESGIAKGRCEKLKILGSGTLDKKLTVKAHAFSKSARGKIESAGGTCEVISD